MDHPSYLFIAVPMALPKDMLSQRVTVDDAPPYEPVETSPGEEEMARLGELLEESQNPLFVLGGSRWSEGAHGQIHEFADRTGLPIATSYRRSTLFYPLHPLYAGDLGLGPNPKLVTRAKAADLLVLVGGRLGEIPSQGYSLILSPSPETRLVHIHPGAEEIGRVYRPHLAIHASPNRFVAALKRLAFTPNPAWRVGANAAHADFVAWTETATPQPGGVNLGEIVIWLRDHVPADTILCNGAGFSAFRLKRARGAFSAPHWLPRSKRLRADAGHAESLHILASGVFVLWLFTKAAENSGLCGESKSKRSRNMTKAEAKETPSSRGRRLSNPASSGSSNCRS